MTKEQEDAVRIIAEEGARANEEMLRQCFPPQVAAPETNRRKGNQQSKQHQSE